MHIQGDPKKEILETMFGIIYAYILHKLEKQ